MTLIGISAAAITPFSDLLGRRRRAVEENSEELHVADQTDGVGLVRLPGKFSGRLVR